MKPKLDSKGKELPFISIGSKSIEAKYYYDGEGETTLFLNGDDDFFYAYKGTLPDHIKELKEYMADLNNQMTVCRNALEKMQSLKLPSPPKSEPEVITMI